MLVKARNTTHLVLEYVRTSLSLVLARSITSARKGRPDPWFRIRTALWR